MSNFQEIERRALEDHQRSAVMPRMNDVREEDVLYVTLRTGFAVCSKISNALAGGRVFKRKSDNSPETKTDGESELLAKQMFDDAFGVKVATMGEESGGAFVPEGYCAAFDPIDGTWGFIADNGTFSTTLNIYRDGKPFIGVVAQPSSSELMYATAGNEPSRMLRATRWGAQSQWLTLPERTDQKSILVNMHGQPKDGKYMQALYGVWAKDGVQQVRSTGGSPAGAMSSVAKGSEMYATNWKKPSTPYDLAAALLIVDKAGGETVDLEGNPIQAIGHSGLLIAGLRKEHIKTVREILKGAC